MALEKLRIKPLGRSTLGEVVALFNPNTYTVSKSVVWSAPPATAAQASASANSTERRKNAPTLTFGGGGSRQLTLELFFDVTEPIAGVPIEDVREQTNKVVALTRIERDLAQPPTCEVSWGTAPVGSDFPFTGVISQLTQRFTMFRANGKPVRASLNLTFTEFLDPEKDKRETDPLFTTRLVRRGDSLQSIAAEVYRDPTAWRVIAEANELDDPRQLTIGLRLNIPQRP